jgi:hypothetical protein
VNGQHLVTLDDANSVEIGRHDERAPRAVVRNGVVVEVEPNVRCLADLNRHALVREE